MTKSAQNYEVGYKKPPKDTQWQPGMSGNPSGKAKKTKPKLGLMDALVTELSRLVTFTNNGKKVKMTVSEILMKKMVDKAANANVKDQLAVLQSWHKLGVFTAQTQMLEEESEESEKFISSEIRAVLEIINRDIKEAGNFDEMDDDDKDSTDEGEEETD